jgi:NAD(P)-dependent dehydrogenase (short-subunit alcohol dehydrogenase family)
VRPGSAFERGDVTLAKEEMEINFFGALRLLQAFGPIMRARGADGENSAAAYVNTLSVFAFSDWPRFGLNCAAQAAALALAQNARAEFAGSGVKVLNAFHGPLDDEWAQDLPPPKVAPSRLAKDVMNALREGVEQIEVGDIAQDIHERWRESPAVLERELTTTKLGD